MKSTHLPSHDFNKGKIVGAVQFVYEKKAGTLKAENQETSKSNEKMCFLLLPYTSNSK